MGCGCGRKTNSVVRRAMRSTLALKRSRSLTPIRKQVNNNAEIISLRKTKCKKCPFYVKAHKVDKSIKKCRKTGLNISTITKNTSFHCPINRF